MPYGLCDSEPVTWAATNIVADLSCSGSPSQGTISSPTPEVPLVSPALRSIGILSPEVLRSRIANSLNQLDALEQDKLAISQELADPQRVSAALRQDGVDQKFFFRFLETPASWLRTRPGVLCLFRALQQSDTMFTIFEGWAASCSQYTWTDITEGLVFDFVSSLWRAVLAEQVRDTKVLMISHAAFDFFHTTLGTTHVVPSHVWSGIPTVFSRWEDAHSIIAAPPSFPLGGDDVHLGLCILPELTSRRYNLPVLNHTYAANVFHQMLSRGSSPSTQHTLLFVQQGSDVSLVCTSLATLGRAYRLVSGIYFKQSVHRRSTRLCWST